MNLKRRLLRCEVDLDSLPPFALSPEQVFCLKSDARQWHYHPKTLDLELRGLDDTGVFIVQGLRCVRADRLG